MLEAAKELPRERRVTVTSATDLAVAARITRATFLSHFRSKEELLVALWEEQVGNIGALLGEHLSRPPSSEERIRLLFADPVEAVDRRPGYLEVVAIELERASSQETLAARSARFHDQLRRIVDAGLDRATSGPITTRRSSPR